MPSPPFPNVLMRFIMIGIYSLYRLTLPLTFCSYKKLAIFTTNVDAENQTLINHKTVCGALNRHFCQTRVTSWCSVFRCSVVHCLQCLWCFGLVALFDFFCVGLCGCKKYKCATKCVGYVKISSLNSTFLKLVDEKYVSLKCFPLSKLSVKYSFNSISEPFTAIINRLSFDFEI